MQLKYLVVIMLVGVFVGCSSKLPDDMPALQPVKLTFKQGDRPLSNAEIMLFSLSSEDRRWGAGGIANEKGEVEPVTLGKYPGVSAGNYKIVVRKIDRDPSTFVGENTPEREVEFEAAEAKRKVYSLVPKEYTDFSTTPLEVEIVSGKNSKTFDLGEPVREHQPLDGQQ